MARRVGEIKHLTLNKETDLKLDLDKMEFSAQWGSRGFQGKDGDAVRKQVLQAMEEEESIEWESRVVVKIDVKPRVRYTLVEYATDGAFTKSGPTKRIRHLRGHHHKLYSPRPTKYGEMITHLPDDEETVNALARLRESLTNFHNHLCIVPERGAYWMEEVADRIDKVFAKEEETDNGATAPPQQGGGA